MITIAFSPAVIGAVGVNVTVVLPLEKASDPGIGPARRPNA